MRQSGDDFTSGFFPYRCDDCANPLCERMALYPLALDYEEETLCPQCLAQREGQPVEVLLPQLKRYIQSRDCFRKPWQAVDTIQCPRLPEGTCQCQDPS
jgi:hypothetical protein